MLFFADENISNLVIARLRASGHDVEVLARDERGATDTTVLARATSADRIVITEDRAISASW